MNISIIIINYNAKKYLGSCLSSLQRMGKTITFEIIVVDNASTDNSVAMMQTVFPAVMLVSNPVNVGFGKANNQGVNLTRGKYILLLNNDTELKNNALAIMARFLDDNPNIGILTCKLFEPDGQIQKNCRSFPLTPFDTMFGRASLLSKIFPNNPITRRNTLSGWDYNSARQIDWVSGACMLVRREVFDQIGLLDENFFMYWEDTDLCKRARDAGWEIWYTPDGEIIHFSGQGGGKRALALKLYTIYQMHRSAYYYFLKHHYKTPFHPMAGVTLLGMIMLVTVKSVQVTLALAVNTLLRR